MIYVAPIHNPIPGAVRYISQQLPNEFRGLVAVHQTKFDPRIALDKTRNQYNSTILLAELLQELPSKHAKIIGITEVDLFIPVLTFVFGEAQLNGNVAVASSHRLRNSYYGLPENPDLVLERLYKEAVHELGHVFSLTHCDNYRCVMHAATGVEELDLKNAAFCSACNSVLRSASF
ncbi:MAG: archaemetzincin family Zn-dependent metalloprotease [Candidatus Krumholzibacteria bacterium]|nr:archaemetzincin family Zn-dependent metalloprotease [Candidatus Krumholzibacteria bacterium]